jgi:hypothetical protein
MSAIGVLYLARKLHHKQHSPSFICSDNMSNIKPIYSENDEQSAVEPAQNECDIIDDELFEIQDVLRHLSVGYVQHENSNIADLSGLSSELLQGLSFRIVIENHEEWLSQILIMEFEFISEVDSVSILDTHRTYSHTVSDARCAGFLFNNPIIKSYFSGILDVNRVKLLEENLQGMLQYLGINADNLIQAILCKDSQFHLAFGFSGLLLFSNFSP